MARGWGRSEEDLEAEKEDAKAASRAPGSGERADARRAAEARSIRLSLARIDDQLAHTTNEGRRLALETARRELSDRLAELPVTEPTELP